MKPTSEGACVNCGKVSRGYPVFRSEYYNHDRYMGRVRLCDDCYENYIRREVREIVYDRLIDTEGYDDEELYDGE